MQLPAHREDPGLRYVTGSLVVGVFCAGVAGGVAFPTLPRLESVLGISPLVVGLIVSMNGITRLLMNAPAGSMFDRVGTRWPMITGFAILAVAPFGYALGLDPGPLPLSSATVFLVARGAWGVGTAITVVGAFATITHLTTPANRGRWLGYLVGSNSLGLPVGFAVGGIVADVYGVRAAFLLAGVVVVAATFLVGLVLPDGSPDVARPAGLRAIPGLVRADRRVAGLGALNAVSRFLAAVFLSTIVLYAAEIDVTVGQLSASGVGGVVLALSAVCAGTSNLVVGRYSDAIDQRMRIVVPALACVGTGFLIAAAVPTLPGLLVGVTVAGLGGGAVPPPLLASLGDISPAEDVGKLGGVFNVLGDVGSIVGPVVAIPLASTAGFATEYYACAGIALLTGLLVGGMLRSAPGTANPDLDA